MNEIVVRSVTACSGGGPEGGDVADEVAHRETLARLRAAVDRLPAAERSAVLGAADHRPPRERERLRRRGLEMLRFALGDLTC